ncbi:MAG: VanZ family protein [Oscillospiraceae bacterium]|nr:VanZ family protein [Oscillospiraceae bacterium]
MKLRNFLYPLLLAALMIFIFCMSAQPADDSTETSSRFCTFAAKLLISNFEEFSPAVQSDIIEGLAFVVRKTAHFSEYALMGCLWFWWLHQKRFSPLIALGASALFAVSDEIHQRFVPGRSCELRDVLVDSSGALAGICFAFIVLCIIWSIRNQSWKQHP